MDKEAQSTLARSVGRAIAHRRIRAGLTQEQVAERLGLGLSAVARMEQGVSIPTVVRLAELAELFRCGIDELLVETSMRSEDQAKAIVSLLNGLDVADRATLMDVMARLVENMKRRTAR